MGSDRRLHSGATYSHSISFHHTNFFHSDLSSHKRTRFVSVEKESWTDLFLWTHFLIWSAFVSSLTLLDSRLDPFCLCLYCSTFPCLFLSAELDCETSPTPSGASSLTCPNGTRYGQICFFSCDPNSRNGTLTCTPDGWVQTGGCTDQSGLLVSTAKEDCSHINRCCDSSLASLFVQLLTLNLPLLRVLALISHHSLWLLVLFSFSSSFY